MTMDPQAPVEHEVFVSVDADTAFRLYVTRPGRTHPGEGQSGDPAEIVYEPFVGGRWYERDPRVANMTGAESWPGIRRDG